MRPPAARRCCYSLGSSTSCCPWLRCSHDPRSRRTRARNTRVRVITNGPPRAGLIPERLQGRVFGSHELLRSTRNCKKTGCKLRDGHAAHGYCPVGRLPVVLAVLHKPRLYGRALLQTLGRMQEDARFVCSKELHDPAVFPCANSRNPPIARQTCCLPWSLRQATGSFWRRRRLTPLLMFRSPVTAVLRPVSSCCIPSSASNRPFCDPHG
jgi:hypothetical protein